MSEIKRSDALDKMLVGIYGNRNVNYDQKTVIINDDRIKKTLYSPVSIANVQYLIELTFTCVDVKFEDKKRGKNFNLTKENVIKNTIAYFRSLGIDIPEVVNKTEIQLLANRLCNSLIEQILPAIFRNIRGTKSRFEIEMDDISLAFNRAIKIIKTDFCSDYFFEWLYTDIKASEVEKLFDSDFNKEECNYEVLVDSFTRNIIEKYNYLTSVYYFDLNTEWINAIDRYSSVEHIFDKSDYFSHINNRNLNEESCTETFDTSADSFMEFPFVNQDSFENKDFIRPYYCINKENLNRKTNNKHGEYCIRFNTCLPNSHFVPKYFYFMTKLNEKIIEEVYPGCKTSNMLDRRLKEKAVEQLKEKYTDEIIQYYKSLLVNIEDMCGNFLSTDIEKILSYRVASMEDFKNIMSHLCNKNDIDAVWYFCQEHGLNVQQSIRYIYCGIEDAMYDFLCLISDSINLNWIQYNDVIKKNLSVSEIKKHVRNIQEILKSKNLDKLYEIRSNYNSFKWDTNKGFNLTYKNDSDTWPRMGVDENIYQHFKTSIMYYCDNLNSDL